MTLEEQDNQAGDRMPEVDRLIVRDVSSGGPGGYRDHTEITSWTGGPRDGWVSREREFGVDGLGRSNQRTQICFRNDEVTILETAQRDDKDDFGVRYLIYSPDPDRNGLFTTDSFMGWVVNEGAS